MKGLLRRFMFSKTGARLLIKPVLRWHSRLYSWAGQMAVVLNDGIHPKHGILRYKEWFLDNIEPGWTVVDIGCNTGMMPFLLARKAAYVYGIETDESLLAVARLKHARPNIEYIRADATTYDYTACRKIDCVTLSNVLEHIEDRLGFLKKIITQLPWADENRKRILIRVPMIEREWIALYKKQLGLEWRLDESHHIEYTQDEFAREMERAGVALRKLDIRFGEFYAVCEAKPAHA